MCLLVVEMRKNSRQTSNTHKKKSITIGCFECKHKRESETE